MSGGLQKQNCRYFSFSPFLSVFCSFGDWKGEWEGVMLDIGRELFQVVIEFFPFLLLFLSSFFGLCRSWTVTRSFLGFFCGGFFCYDLSLASVAGEEKREWREGNDIDDETNFRIIPCWLIWRVLYVFLLITSAGLCFFWLGIVIMKGGRLGDLGGVVVAGPLITIFFFFLCNLFLWAFLRDFFHERVSLASGGVVGYIFIYLFDFFLGGLARVELVSGGVW